MSDHSLRTRRYVATAVIYLALVGSVFGFNVFRSRAAKPQPPAASEERPPTVASATASRRD